MEQQNGATNATGSAAPKLVTTNSDNVKTYDYVIRNYCKKYINSIVLLQITYIRIYYYYYFFFF